MFELPRVQSEWVHVCPAWVAGERTLHPKFGGSKIVGGISLVEDRLRIIKSNFPDDLSSGHVFHEVAMPEFEKYNSPNAIPYDKLVKGIEAGEFPMWSAMTAPAFGLGIRGGFILNEDPEVRRMARAAHKQAVFWSRDLYQKGFGSNKVIWWPAFDGRSARGHLADIPWSAANEKTEDFWVGFFKEDDLAVVYFEFKPSVPSRLDFWPTMKAACAFCHRVNKRVGRQAMFVNLEWAHALIGGQSVEEATRLQICEGMFGGFFHANSAEKAIVEWNSEGTEILAGTPGDDADWAAGCGGPELFSDQLKAVRLLDGLGVKIVVEHDIDPSGDDPLEIYGVSRGNLERMIGLARGEAAVGRLLR